MADAATGTEPPFAAEALTKPATPAHRCFFAWKPCKAAGRVLNVVTQKDRPERRPKSREETPNKGSDIETSQK